MIFDIDKMYCGAIRRGDVMLYEGAAGQREAAVILQDDILNQGLPTIVGASIEPRSAGEEVFANEVLLKGTESGLGQDGICMLHKMVTIDRRLVVAKKAELNQEKLREIYEAMDINLGRFRDERYW